MKAREGLMAAALSVSLAVNVGQGITQGEEVPPLRAVGDFSAAFADTSSDFNRMVTYGREIPLSWHKVWTAPNFPDTMVVAMWPLRELVCLFPRPLYSIKVYTDPPDSSQFDLWWSTDVAANPAEGDTLEWTMTFAPRDSIMVEGNWMLGNECFLIQARAPGQQ